MFLKNFKDKYFLILPIEHRISYLRFKNYLKIKLVYTIILLFFYISLDYI